jgi:acetylornithine deacetylase/succinyl-diaminopimelate desuccinylase-like protein
MNMLPPALETWIQHLATAVDPDRYVAVLEQLIAIPSLTGEERNLADWIADRLRTAGIGDVQVDDCNNVVARFGSGKRRLLISAHMDTMAPHPQMAEPFVPRTTGQGDQRVIYGLGAASSKACLASIIEALTVLAASDAPLPTITFTGVARDLHPTRHGIKELFERHRIEAEGAFVGEPTNGRIGVGARGYAHIAVDFSGETHHAGRPDNRRNPVAGAAEFIQRSLAAPLPDHPLLGTATLTPIEIASQGSRPHTPRSAAVLLDRRLVPADPPIDELLKQTEALARSISDQLDVSLGLHRHQFPWVVERSERVVTALSSSLEYVSGAEPTVYALPFSSSSGFLKNVPGITPVAFSGGDIQRLGPDEHAVLATNIHAAQAFAGAVVLFESL